MGERVTAETAPPLLEITGLSARYGAALALDGVCLRLAAGEVLGLAGVNGAGKSTLLRTVIGLHPAAAGDVRFNGASILHLAADVRARLGLGYAPEGRRVFPGLSVRDNLLAVSRENAAARQGDLEGVFALFPQLAAKAGEAAWRLSGGQQQMLALARALMTRPKLLLLDEPTLGLAPAVAGEVLAKITQIAAMGVGVLIAEQNVARFPPAVARAAALAGGRLIADGSPADAHAALLAGFQRGA